MEYYERCKLIVEVPDQIGFDETVIRRALIEKMPGLEIEFTKNPAMQKAKASQAEAPIDHDIASHGEIDPATGVWRNLGARLIVWTAEEVLRSFE